jgi:hypothetical protein
MPSSTTEERGVKLAAAENYLRRSARAQRLGRTWVMHALNLAVNAAAALVLADGYGEWLKQSGHDPERTALWYVLAGTALGELQILTGPYRCIRAQKSYLGTYGDSRVPRLNLQFGPTCGGLGVKLAAEF